MFQLYSKGCEYAIRAFTCVVPSGDQTRFSAREVCKAADIPEPFTRKVLQSLVQAGFLTATRGPQGGYVLTRPPEEVSILEIIKAVDGEDTFDGCILGLAECDIEHPCPLHHLWSDAKQRLQERLQNITMKQLIDTTSQRKELARALSEQLSQNTNS